ncbi:hypothetical protein TEA_020109 [Camellia sinensis var. sinensis]|uniref:BSD domain-containing protein n=1 Tax=Camellia sinensis var. sinensis TaxID=542762 RepID=A0A4V3WJW7_CAMSN|nr:hypothetical protein TEA_020109 [Camellia sinensis var. sinensis]
MEGLPKAKVLPALEKVMTAASVPHKLQSSPVFLKRPSVERKRVGKRVAASMDFWQRARSFAEEAAKRSQELTKEAAKRSQDITIGSSKLSDIVSEASKRSKEIAAEASKRADQIKVEALKRADQIKSQIPGPAAAALSSLVDASPDTAAEAVDLEKFGVTDELREFVKGITINTFRDFPLEDDSETSDNPPVSNFPVSNVRQDLTAFQEIHAKLVLSTVKETSTVQTTSKTEAGNMNLKSKTSSSTEQDLDVFLLGDLGDSDEGPDVPPFHYGTDELPSTLTESLERLHV